MCHANSSLMKTVVSISSKINFNVKYFTKDDEGHFTMIKRSVHLGGKKKTKGLYIYDWVIKYVKEKFIKLKQIKNYSQRFQAPYQKINMISSPKNQQGYSRVKEQNQTIGPNCHW